MLTVNLKKHFYKEREIVFRLDVSFSVGSGFSVITGSSGAGKTSILRLIAGILAPDEGFVEVDSQIYYDSARKINLSIQERRVGYVFQDYALFPHLTALQNIAYGVKADEQKLKNEKAREMLSIFRIEHVCKRVPREMSGGERQRVALARALASDPAIVLLDEPLSAVDVETRAKLLDEIENAQLRALIPFIYVTHNEREAERFGKHRIKLKNGSIFNE
ncbi:MAG TPA: ATP-binding cassette domain-containing protein [Pyrinomonadaceae bacterium]|jgi:molybdate transport system ATP-binding protein